MGRIISEANLITLPGRDIKCESATPISPTNLPVVTSALGSESGKNNGNHSGASIILIP
jgi:hypothetical protein